MKWLATTASGTGQTFRVTDPGSQWQGHMWHAYFGNGVTPETWGGATVSLQYSPDDTFIPDASSRWFSPSALSRTSDDDVWFQAKFRKIRLVWSGGGAGTSVDVEIV